MSKGLSGVVTRLQNRDKTFLLGRKMEKSKKSIESFSLFILYVYNVPYMLILTIKI